ncbi:MAG: tRNA pseudouridine(38-40) synthase TruA [Bacteroidales bacterium]
MRYFLHIAYDGTNYRGWQRGPNALGVQEVIESALQMQLKEKVPIVGCGRTDAEVHASQFFFHIDLEKKLHPDLLFRLNKALPADIAVFDIIPMDGLPHARFDAYQRTYDYFIHTYKDPFLSGVSSLYLEKHLDLQKMKQAVELLPKYNDYRAFCKSPNRYEHTICDVSKAVLYADENGEKIRFHISSNRFLGGMIRIIVGKLIKIGTGHLSVEQFEHFLTSLETPKTIIPAYPQGLFLSKVTYPFLDLPPRTEFASIIRHNSENSWLEV